MQGGSEARGERSYCAPELPYMSVCSLNPRLRRASACAPLFGKRQAGQRAAQLAVLQLDGCLNLAKGQLLRLVEQQQDDGLRRAGGITAAGLLAGGLCLECRRYKLPSSHATAHLVQRRLQLLGPAGEVRAHETVGRGGMPCQLAPTVFGQVVLTKLLTEGSDG